jgi:hypothetical protein
MKTITVAAAALVALVACSSSQKAKIIPPELQIRELVGPSDMGYPRGVVEVQYEVRIGNRSGEPITLRRIDIQSVGTGAYTLRHEAQNFNRTIDPDHFDTVTFWVRALARGDRMGGNEPVTVRGVAYFDTPVGPTQKVFLTNIGQFPGQRD